MTASPGNRRSDPLIPDDLSGWSANLTSVISRSWRKILVVLAVTALIPVIASAIGGLFINEVASQMLRDQADELHTPTAAFLNDARALGARLGIVLVVSLLTAYLSCVGWAAALRIALVEAADRRVSIGESLQYGFRRGLRMWGWYVLAAVCVMVGICVFVLPGVYLIVVFGLFGPVVVCETGPALARSLRLVHRSFAKILGRMLLLLLFVLTITCATALLAGLFTSPLSGVQATVTTAEIASDAIGSYLSTLLVGLLLTGGLLVTYAEARAAEEPGLTTTAMLDGAPE
ncbi:hypothetical protein [Stackebrandtia soli]|uniref:hypothetical protein n=1 Tax=Stackebrandtia soli TaxID=1892856 RepID=UPI0039ECB269